MKEFAYLLLSGIAITLSGCSSDEWRCVRNGDAMYSMNTSGELGGAQKGCSCSEIRAFEKQQFGYVDEGALKSDFGC